MGFPGAHQPILRILVLKNQVIRLDFIIETHTS